MKIKLFLTLLLSLSLVGCLPSDAVYSNSNEFKVVTKYDMSDVKNRARPYNYIYIIRDGSEDCKITLYSDIDYNVGDIISFEVKESTAPVLEK